MLNAAEIAGSIFLLPNLKWIAIWKYSYLPKMQSPIFKIFLIEMFPSLNKTGNAIGVIVKILISKFQIHINKYLRISIFYWIQYDKKFWQTLWISIWCIKFPIIFSGKFTHSVLFCSCFIFIKIFVSLIFFHPHIINVILLK